MNTASPPPRLAVLWRGTSCQMRASAFLLQRRQCHHTVFVFRFETYFSPVLTTFGRWIPSRVSLPAVFYYPGGVPMLTTRHTCIIYSQVSSVLVYISLLLWASIYPYCFAFDPTPLHNNTQKQRTCVRFLAGGHGRGLLRHYHNRRRQPPRRDAAGPRQRAPGKGRRPL